MSKGKLTDIKRKTDAHSLIAAKNLKEAIERKIKKVYVSALRCIELRFGDNFDGYETLRREILRAGNDAIREMNTTIDNSFNVEQIPEVLTVKFTNKERENEGTDII